MHIAQQSPCYLQYNVLFGKKYFVRMKNCSPPSLTPPPTGPFSSCMHAGVGGGWAI